MRGAIDYTAQTTAGAALVAGSVFITDLNDVGVTVYADSTSATTVANPQSTGTDGRIGGYLPTGTYKFVLNGTTTTVKEVIASADLLPATSTTKGTIQLTNSLAGTGTSPTLASGSVTDATVAAANKDGTATTPSLRTLGSGASQALAGNTRLDQVAAPTANVSLNTHTLTNVVDPVNAQDAATKNYVDANIGGAPATTTTVGVVQLAGDLGGTGTTATAPVISAGAITAGKIANTTITDAQIAAGNKDGTTTTPGLRTLGYGPNQALAGNTRLDQITAPTASVSVNSHTITNVSDPVTPQDAATKNYVDTYAGIPRPACLLWAGTPPTVNNGVDTTVTFNTVVHDNDSMTNLGSFPGRITINTPGLYVFTAVVIWQAGNQAWSRRTNIRRANVGSAVVAEAGGPVPTGGVIQNPSHTITSPPIKCNTGDWFNVNCFQDSGGSVGLSSFSDGTGQYRIGTPLFGAHYVSS